MDTRAVPGRAGGQPRGPGGRTWPQRASGPAGHCPREEGLEPAGVWPRRTGQRRRLRVPSEEAALGSEAPWWASAPPGGHRQPEERQHSSPQNSKCF